MIDPACWHTPGAAVAVSFVFQVNIVATQPLCSLVVAPMFGNSSRYLWYRRGDEQHLAATKSTRADLTRPPVSIDVGALIVCTDSSSD